MDKAKLFALAEKAVAKGQTDKALEAFEALLRADPNDLKVLNRAADLYLKEENFSKAVEYLKRIGVLYSKDGFYSKAAAVYKRILKIDQASSKADLIEIHEHLAGLYGQLGLISDAMSHFAIAVDFYDQTGENEKLLQVLKRVGQMDPTNIETQLKLAQLFASQDKVTEAHETLNSLVENLKAKGPLADLVRVYEKSLEIFPQDLSRVAELVELYLKSEEPKKALAKIQIAFRADPKNPTMLELLSTVFQSLKQPDKAKAVDVELVKIYRNLGDEEKAVNVETRLAGTSGNRDTFTGQTNVGQTNTGKNPSALDSNSAEPLEGAEALIRGMALSPDEKKILSECDVYSKYGLVEKAYEVLNRRLSEFPKSLPLRWKLKVAAQELKKSDRIVHLLSEIVLLAKENKLADWQSLGEDELAQSDPAHPSLPQAVPLAAPRAKPAPAPSVMPDMEASEISIVVEEESFEDNDVSDISLNDFVPEVKQVKAVAEESRDSNAESQSILLSEADFSPEELNQLSKTLSPQEPEPTTSAVIELDAFEEEELEVEKEPPQSDIKQALEEVEFYRSQGLKSEADALMKKLKEKNPDFVDPHESKIKQKQTHGKTLGTKTKFLVQEDDRAENEGDFFDLGSELQQELAEEKSESGSGSRDFQDVFNAFKKGVSETIDTYDWQAHLDLGIAYREMGLVDDAIEEFKLVAQTPDQKVGAYYQLGVCEFQRANYNQAQKYFDAALKEPGLGDQQKLSVSYELGEALLKLNAPQKAMALFQSVQKLDPDFRDVGDRIAEITKKIQLS